MAIRLGVTDRNVEHFVTKRVRITIVGLLDLVDLEPDHIDIEIERLRRRSATISNGRLMRSVRPSQFAGAGSWLNVLSRIWGAAGYRGSSCAGSAGRM